MTSDLPEVRFSTFTDDTVDDEPVPEKVKKQSCAFDLSAQKTLIKINNFFTIIKF